METEQARAPHLWSLLGPRPFWDRADARATEMQRQNTRPAFGPGRAGHHAVMKLRLLVVRAVVGALFVGHGAQKLFGWFGGHGPEATGQFFENVGMRPGRRNADRSGHIRGCRRSAAGRRPVHPVGGSGADGRDDHRNPSGPRRQGPVGHRGRLRVQPGAARDDVRPHRSRSRADLRSIAGLAPSGAERDGRSPSSPPERPARCSSPSLANRLLRTMLTRHPHPQTAPARRLKHQPDLAQPPYRSFTGLWGPETMLLSCPPPTKEKRMPKAFLTLLVLGSGLTAVQAAEAATCSPNGRS